MNGKRPVSVVTGFLGSGKTTLLSRLLHQPGMENTAVLVNEIGEVGLDHHLLERVDETTVLLENGCVCCTRREELAGALRGLLEREERGETPPVRRVVVETSGLADPSPIPFTILDDPVLRHHYAPGGVLATADAVNGPLHLRDNPESVRQIAAADEIFITKTDLVDTGSAESLRESLGRINPDARFVCGLPPEDEPALPDSILAAGYGSGTPDRATSGASLDHTSETGVRTASLTFDEPLDWTNFGVWLSALLHARGEDVLRVKGLLDTGDSGPTSINGVQHVVHPPDHLPSWPEGGRRSQLVFITRNIDPAEISASLRAFQSLPQRTS